MFMVYVSVHVVARTRIYELNTNINTTMNMVWERAEGRLVRICADT